MLKEWDKVGNVDILSITEYLFFATIILARLSRETHKILTVNGFLRTEGSFQYRDLLKCSRPITKPSVGFWFLNVGGDCKNEDLALEERE